jgi:hypothetical protein
MESMTSVIGRVKGVLMELLRVVFGVAITFGSVVVLLTLLNRRDGRASRLRHTAFEQVALPDLYGRVGVQIWCALLSRRSTVIVDLLAATPYEVWNVFTRLASSLPPHVRLVVHSAVDREFTGLFTLKTTTGRLTPHHSCMSLVIG